ncbi:MAG: dihydrofolate reductase family protein [Candidatus Pacebacteria bacterium]|nr:dihydrofolate reductase family protein [Candidatus Paceibacterota bacterium]
MSNKEKIKPFIFLCTGMSLDGKISTSKRVNTRITTDDDRNFLYDHRVLCDAIMMGGKSIILDDPGLVVKSVQRQKQRLALGKTLEPIKVGIISDVSKLKMNGDFLNKGDVKKIIFTTERSSEAKIKALSNKAEIFVYGKQKVNLKRALAKLYTLGIKSIMVEGGGELIFSLLKDDLVDEINLKIGDLILGGRIAPTLCDGEGFSGLTAKQVKLVDLKRKENYLMLKYKVIKNIKK